MKMVVRAEDLHPGDRVLLPPVVVQRVHLNHTHVTVITEEWYPCGYRRGDSVAIERGPVDQ